MPTSPPRVPKSDRPTGVWPAETGEIMRLHRVLPVAAVLLAALVFVPGSPTEAAQPAELSPSRPNIVVVMMDDMRWDELRFAPNARRYVADRGITFANSFSPLPLCCPARASFLTGKFAHNHGVMHVNAAYGFGAFDDSTTLATSLSAAGYNTALVGKYLNGYGEQPSLVTGGPSLLYKPAGWTDWMASTSKRWGRRSPYAGGTYNYLNFTQNINGRIVMHRRQYSSTVIASEAAGLVGKYHAKGKPFFLFVTPVAPHMGGPHERRDPKPYRKASGYRQEFKTPYAPKWVQGRFDRQITHAPGVPLSHPAEPDISDKRVAYRAFTENTRTEKVRLRNVERQRAESIYAWDREFGKLVQRLKDTGEYDDTVLMFTSDNGYYMGEHRHPAGKIEHHEVSSRVPLTVAGPGIGQGIRYAPAMTQDLTSTILDVAGAQPLPAMDGTSLRPVLQGPDQGWERPVILEALLGVPVTEPNFPARVTEFGIRTGRYKYVRYADGEEELYDLAADPNELTGLQRDPASAELLQRMRGLWDVYAGCRGEQCTVPLPTDLQVDVPELARIDANAQSEWDAYYNH